MLPPSLAGWMSSTPDFLLWSLQQTSQPDGPLANLPIWMLLNLVCTVWSRNCKVLGTSPVFLDFLQQMPAISQKYLDQLSPVIHPSRRGLRAKVCDHYKMIVTFQHCLLCVIEDVLLSSLSSDPHFGPLEPPPAPISSMLLNPATEAAAVLELAGACQVACEKDLAKGSRKQTQQTKSQKGQRGSSAQSSSRRAVTVTPPADVKYTPPPTPPDHAAGPVSNGQVAVTAAATMLGQLLECGSFTMSGVLQTPLKVLTTVVEVRYGPPSSPAEVGRVPFCQMSLASLEGLKLLLEVAVLVAGAKGSLKDLVWLMQQTLFLLHAAACGTSFEQRQAFIADRGKLLLQVLWRVGKAISAESQQKQPDLDDPDVVVLTTVRLMQRNVISVMVEFLDLLVRPCSTGSSIIAGKYTLQFMMKERSKYAACRGVMCVLV